jgi:hypothetical protein
MGMLDNIRVRLRCKPDINGEDDRLSSPPTASDQVKRLRSIEYRYDVVILVIGVFT